MYLAFGDDRRFEGPLGDKDQPAAIAVEARASDVRDDDRARSKRASFRRSRSGPASARGAGTPASAARNTALKTMKQPSLFDLPSASRRRRAGSGRRATFAVDPANDVVLEASAGTGKTRVLVDRYVRLIEVGRRSAAHPRDHVHAQSGRRDARARARRAAAPRGRRRAGRRREWRALRDRIADIQISTIDAFCFGLLREFPLEADVEPGFDIADETEMGRFANEAMDLALRAARGLILKDDETLRLLFARVKLPVLRERRRPAARSPPRRAAGRRRLRQTSRGDRRRPPQAASAFVARLRASLRRARRSGPRSSTMDRPARRSSGGSRADLCDLDDVRRRTIRRGFSSCAAGSSATS